MKAHKLSSYIINIQSCPCYENLDFSYLMEGACSTRGYWQAGHGMDETVRFDLVNM